MGRGLPAHPEKPNRPASQTAVLDAGATEWHETITLAAQLATRCAETYRDADDRVRRLFNQAYFDSVDLSDGRIRTVNFRAPFDALFASPRFEYETLVDIRWHQANTRAVEAPVIVLAVPNTVLRRGVGHR